MATLTYDMAVVGRRVVESELASLERRFVQHSAALNRISTNAVRQASAPQSSRRATMYGPGPKEYAASLRAREKAELASARLVAREKTAQDRSLASARTSLDRQRSAALYKQHTTELAQAKLVQDRRLAFVKSTLGSAAQRVTGTIGALGKAGISAVGLSGVGLAASSISQAVRLDEMTRRLAIAGRAPGEQGADPAALRKTFTETAIKTGIAPEEIAAGAATYVAKTGDLKTAMANTENFATFAQATGASASDVASTAADLAQKFDIKNAEDMAAALAVLADQGKRGAFEIKDMAQQFPEMAAAAQRAGLSGVKGMRTLGGLAQIARESTGSGAEASTAVQMMLTQLTTKADKLKSGEALGGQSVNVFEGGDPTKKARELPTVLAEIISKSNGNQTELAKLFDVRGLRAVSPLIATYRAAADSAVGKTPAERQEAGKQAVLARISTASESKATWSEVQRDAGDAMGSVSVQFEIAMTRLKDAMATQLFPEVVKLVPQLAELAPLVGDLASTFVRALSFLANNPWLGLGAVVSGAIVMELGKAAIGEVVGAALAAMVARMSAAPAVAGGIGAGAGVGGLLGAAGAAAVGVGLAADQAVSFASENGGWGGTKAFFGVGTDGWGFDGVNEYMNKQARDEAAARDFQASAPTGQVDTSRLPAIWQDPQKPIVDTTLANEALASVAASAKAAAAALGGVPTPNRGNKPTGGIKYFE